MQRRVNAKPSRSSHTYQLQVLMEVDEDGKYAAPPAQHCKVATAKATLLKKLWSTFGT